jgi:hypothetical protein
MGSPTDRDSRLDQLNPLWYSKYMSTSPIDASTFSRRLVALCLKSGVIPFPAKPADRAILEKSMLPFFDPHARYSQKGVDAILKQWIQEVGQKIRVDHVTLRRALVDDGFLVRRPDGAAYRLSPKGSHHFTPEVDQVDVRTLIAQESEAIQARRLVHASGATA